MATENPTANKIVRYTLSGALVSGLICLLGCVSFTGMLLLDGGTIYAAIATFFLSGGIEGEVFAQNINSSLFSIFTSDYWENVELDQTLDRFLDNEPSSAFLKEYQALQEYIRKRKKERDYENDLDFKAARKSLALKRRYFKRFILSDAPFNKEEDIFHQELYEEFAALLKKENKNHDKNSIRDEILRIRQQINRKILFSRLAWILYIGAGISSALVGLEVIQSSIIALSTYFAFTISGAALSASVFILAAIGAIGYVLLIHNTITNMIKNDTLRNWARKTRDFFKRKTDESTIKYLCRTIFGALGVTIVLGLAVFTTIATAGTWWHAAKAGAKLIPWISSFARELCAIAVSLMGITSLLFGVVNSLESIKELTRISLHRSWINVKNAIAQYKASENWLQFFNPFRLIITFITIPFRFIVFIGHLFAMGVMADKLDNVPPLATAFIATVYEGTQDAHYFLPEEAHDHAHDEHQMDKHKAEETHDHTEDNNHQHKEHKHKHKHRHDYHDHHHQHTDLIGKFLKLVLSPLYFIAAIWDYACSRFNTPDKHLTFSQALHKSFFGLQQKITHHSEEPLLSEKWTRFETQEALKEVIKKKVSLIAQQTQADKKKSSPLATNSIYIHAHKESINDYQNAYQNAYLKQNQIPCPSLVQAPA